MKIIEKRSLPFSLLSSACAGLCFYFLVDCLREPNIRELYISVRIIILAPLAVLFSFLFLHIKYYEKDNSRNNILNILMIVLVISVLMMNAGVYSALPVLLYLNLPGMLIYVFYIFEFVILAALPVSFAAGNDRLVFSLVAGITTFQFVFLISRILHKLKYRNDRIKNIVLILHYVSSVNYLIFPVLWCITIFHE
jgi:hypothetical protein